MFFSSFFKTHISQRILIIVKKRTLPFYDQDAGSYKSISSGLKNSAIFTIGLLTDLGHTAKLVEVIDNNCINKVVTEFKPDIVIIEALWVIPSKFEILKKIHPTVNWVVRLHSDTPFLAHEGPAIDWLHGYINQKIFIAVNSTKIENELKYILPTDSVLPLPNFYPLSNKIPTYQRSSNDLNIGCFGAIRPMKNHLMQAFAAIKFADTKNLHLNFHINANRCEDKGEPILKNLRALFDNSTHSLIEHSWKDHDQFLILISTMDISMQVSFSETFNIVSADAVSLNVPVVVSPEIFWVNSLFQTSPTSSKKIIQALNFAWYSSKIGTQRLNFYGLESYNKQVKNDWIKALTKLN